MAEINSENHMARAFIAFIFFLVSFDSAWSQKKALDHEVYEFWNRIEERSISPDGDWVSYSQAPEDRDGVLHVKSADGSKSYSFARGEKSMFSPSSEHVIFLIKPPKDSVKAAKKNKDKSKDALQDSLQVLNLESGTTRSFANVMSFKMPKEEGAFLAVLTKVEQEEDSTSADSKSEADKGDEKELGNSLVLIDLANGSSQEIDDVVHYEFADEGGVISYSKSSKDGLSDGTYMKKSGNEEEFVLQSGEGEYEDLTLNKSGSLIAFLSNLDSFDTEEPEFKLYFWNGVEEDSTRVLVNLDSQGIPDDWALSENGELSFSDDESRLFFNTAPKRPSEDDDEPDSDSVDLDVWHWQDPLIQPMQLVQLSDEKKRSYQAVVDLARGKVNQLADELIPSINLGPEQKGDYAISNTNIPYRKEISWEFPRLHDTYLVNLNTGGKKLALKELQDQARLSTSGDYITWWDRNERAWFSQSTEGGSAINLTSALDVNFYNELHDWPYEPDSYGAAGWTKDDRFVVYDKYDLWVLDPAGQEDPLSLTNGEGRQNNLRYRYLKLDPDEKTIDPFTESYLSSFDTESKASGYAIIKLDGRSTPKSLLNADKRFSRPLRSKNGRRMLFTQETFEEFPDLWVSDDTFDGITRMSDANPQQSEYLWGSSELVNWTSADGKSLSGMLYKPEGFNPKKKYPMMVYFYEKMSDNLHQHRAPASSRSSINFSFYVSRGYLLFVPDIPYRVGYPGESAMNAVIPGVTSLVDKGFVDSNRIGVQGHSWGGYQIAYMVTETNIFRAAEAGAPVSNMTSAYGGIRWGSGMSRAFQYERTQSRLGGSLWEKPLRYIDNSPIFQADKIETPLLMMHNDDDGKVPWYQGIELFVAMRRLAKPAWMLNYNGEKHGLNEYKNKRDWAIRMQQYFDHYLMDAPEPEWMKNGIPATRKGKTLGLDLVK